MKAQITLIKKTYDDIRYQEIYEIIIETDKQPKLTLGECEIKQ